MKWGESRAIQGRGERKEVGDRDAHTGSLLIRRKHRFRVERSRLPFLPQPADYRLVELQALVARPPRPASRISEMNDNRLAQPTSSFSVIYGSSSLFA